MQYVKNFAIRVGLLNKATGVYLITSLSGLVDAACFIGLGHVFAEMMTGNLLMLGFSIGVHGLTSNIDRYFLVISFYVVGVIAGSRMLKNKTLWKQERFWVLSRVGVTLCWHDTRVHHAARCNQCRWLCAACFTCVQYGDFEYPDPRTWSSRDGHECINGYLYRVGGG